MPPLRVPASRRRLSSEVRLPNSGGRDPATLRAEMFTTADCAQSTPCHSQTGSTGAPPLHLQEAWSSGSELLRALARTHMEAFCRRSPSEGAAAPKTSGGRASESRSRQSPGRTGIAPAEGKARGEDADRPETEGATRDQLGRNEAILSC